MQRPDDAIILFDGRSLAGWRSMVTGRPAEWAVVDGLLTVGVGQGDILSDETFRDAHIHLEFRLLDAPGSTDSKKGNSGVFLQGKYEIQIIDSYGWSLPGVKACGAIYDQVAPLVDVCKAPSEWQTFDIIFRAARVDGAGAVVDAARITLAHNGRIVHNNAPTTGPTRGAMEGPAGEPGPLRLQDHRSPVQFRNIWLVHLPEVGTEGAG